jgi:cob(I)alamin adenosyltransferase
VRLTRIYTRGGDAGETSRGDGSRASKLDPLVRAYGAVDELNSLLGWAQVEVGAGRGAEPVAGAYPE